MPPGRSSRGGAEQARPGPRPALDRPRRLAPAGIGPRGEGAEVRAGRVEEDAVEARRQPSSAASASITVTLRRPSAPRLRGDFGRALGIELDRDHLAAVAHPGRDLAALDPRAGAEVEDVLARARVEHLDHRGRAAALRRQLAGLDQRRDGSPVRPSTTIDSGAASGQVGPRRRAPRPRPRAAAPGAAARRSARRSVDRASRPRPARCRRRAGTGRPRLPARCHHIRASQSGAEWATAAASGVESSPSSDSAARSRSRAARRSTALTRPDGMGGAGRLDQLDRLVDRGVVGGRVGEQQLVEAEAQRGEHRRIEQPRSSARRAADRRVGGAAALHGAVGEALGLGALAPLEPAPSAASRKARSVWAPSSKVARMTVEGERRGAARRPRWLTASAAAEWPRR